MSDNLRSQIDHWLQKVRPVLETCRKYTHLALAEAKVICSATWQQTRRLAEVGRSLWGRRRVAVGYCVLLLLTIIVLKPSRDDSSHTTASLPPNAVSIAAAPSSVTSETNDDNKIAVTTNNNSTRPITNESPPGPMAKPNADDTSRTRSPIDDKRTDKTDSTKLEQANSDVPDRS